MKMILPNLSRFFRRATFVVAASTLISSAAFLSAATGDELLIGALPPSAINKPVIDGDTLTKAVYEAVLANKSQAPEIVAAAIPKTRSLATQKAVVKAAISALGDYQSLSSGLVPQIVYAAIKAAPNCGSSDGKSDGKSGYEKDGYSKDSNGCHCAEEFTRSAIEALGPNPSERVVTDIVSSAIQASNGRCADQIANAASDAAPQYASAIANAASGKGQTSEFGEIGFGPTDRPIPAPFVVQTPGGGLSSPMTPVR